jgi:Skp family chaperone for outer membrane proteins
MFRTGLLVILLAAGATALGFAQDLRLDDRDLAPFEGELAPPDEGLPSGPPSRSEQRDAVSERYDTLIDRLKEQLRQLRIDLRERPARIADARNRLSSLRSAETDLRVEAYERVVYRLPHPVFEDFDRAVEEALERREIRAALESEILHNEGEIEALEGRLAELQQDLDQALTLKMEAIDEFNRKPPADAPGDEPRSAAPPPPPAH